jgi:hypothetical protein
MKDFLLTLLPLAVTIAKLCGPGGVRAVIAENLVLKQQLIVLRRGRRRAPSLSLSERLLCGFGALFLSPARIRKVAIAFRPSTLMAFHQALVRRKYHRLFSSTSCPKKSGPKGPDEALIQVIVELVAQSSVRLPTDRADHLADVWGRHRQERRAPRVGKTLSPCRRRSRTLVVVVHRPHHRQPLERGPLSMRVDRAPELLGACGHGPVQASSRRHRRALWRRRVIASAVLAPTGQLVNLLTRR